MDIFCLNETSSQKKLRFVSMIYLTVGGLFSIIILASNLLTMLFFVKSARSKRSPICILSFFLAICNVLKLFEFFINLLVKTDVFDLEESKHVLYTGVKPSNDYICKWLHFLPSFSGHIGVYLVLLLQFHRHLALKKPTYSFNLMLHNYALTYFICIGLIFTFLIVDEFYLFESYFTTIIYCPRTMVFICVFNDNFKLLEKFEFNKIIYHHIHTFFYNVMPISLIFYINFLVLKGLRQRAIDASLEPKISSRKASICGGYSATSLRRSSSVNIKEAQLLPLQPPNKRTRLSSSVNLSSGQQPSPLQSIEFSVKRSKRESFPFNLNEIFLQNADVEILSVWLSFIQIFNTVPTNMLSYLAEWTSSTTNLVKDRFTEKGNADYETLFNKIPTNFLGAMLELPQTNIYIVFILYGCIDLFNFSIFLFYQFYSCRLLSIDFKKFLLSFSFFRLFVKPASGVSRNRLNSSGRISSSRRASKI